jgi:hypothetical protein
MVHFFSGTNNIIKSLQLLLCIDLCYYFYYSNIGCWGFQVESPWNPHGIHMESIFPHGIHIEIGWNSCGRFHMDSKWKFHMEWWNPHGIHKESTWNIGGRKSPKWVRSQPKHIPCGMGRFHVE